jgi:hypothetical protein
MRSSNEKAQLVDELNRQISAKNQIKIRERQDDSSYGAVVAHQITHLNSKEEAAKFERVK